jgi:hypothetical protein
MIAADVIRFIFNAKPRRSRRGNGRWCRRSSGVGGLVVDGVGGSGPASAKPATRVALLISFIYFQDEGAEINPFFLVMHLLLSPVPT